MDVDVYGCLRFHCGQEIKAKRVKSSNLPDVPTWRNALNVYYMKH